MKNRTSRPVEVLKSFQLKFCPGTSLASRGWPNGTNDGGRQRHGPGLHLSGIVEHHESHRPGDANQFLDVEQQALVAAEDQAGEWIFGTDGPDIETTHAVFATEKQLREDRQVQRSAERVDVLVLRAKPEREAAGLLQVPDPLDRRLVVIGVAAEPREIERRGVAAAVVGKIGLSTVL